MSGGGLSDDGPVDVEAAWQRFIDTPLADIEELSRLERAATPGPWRAERGPLIDIAAPRTAEEVEASTAILAEHCASKYGLVPHGVLYKDDAAFIAAARNALPVLLAELAVLRARSATAWQTPGAKGTE